MHKLLKKTHNVTGLMYLCYTRKEDHNRYKGSGKDWLPHIREFGNDVTTELLFQHEDKELVQLVAREYSRKWNVSESVGWANRIPETLSGAGGQKGQGRGVKKSEEHKNRIRQSLLGKKKSDETRQKMSMAHLGSRIPEDVRLKMSISHRGKHTEPKSEQHRKNISESLKRFNQLKTILPRIESEVKLDAGVNKFLETL